MKGCCELVGSGSLLASEDLGFTALVADSELRPNLSSVSKVPMMEPADHRLRFDPPEFGWVHRSGFRAILRQSQMGTRSMIVAEVLLEQSSHVPIVEDNRVVQALSPHGAYESLDVGIGLGCRMHPMQMLSSNVSE
jgi:hypothetical protein